ncbi:GNAT family N-acetyltransferase [Streptomyces sp. NBC_00335]|uniref:GNAT family N-acetyltransferase n=1 Tax=unclassified Streptomyces TaxID=2593676 RepID=UPI002251BFDA|nr:MULTISPECIES: GNAT family N-acetyltransferase [unclassified Streptomyces]MCX5405008.1 GNAT family N-acetyltransferase [Streptomyces sp. NBC_00086]
MTITPLSVPPTDTEVDHWWAVLAAARTADLPGTPPPSRTEVAGALRVPSVRGRSLYWATDDAVASLVLFTDGANDHTAFLDELTVRPDARRRGVGSALWERAREELLADGRTSVATEVDLGGPGQAFAESVGFENVLSMAWYVQDVREARWVQETKAAEAAQSARAGSASTPPGYELHCWPGLVPDDRAQAVAVAHGAMEDAPMGELDQQIQTWTAERLHAAHRKILDRGGELTTVAAVTPDGEVAAYTELVLPDPAGPRALQYDTVVVPAHRGHGLGRAVKLRMLAEAATRHPDLRTIATSVADDNTPMLAVNAALGYRRERAVGYFQLHL